MKTDNEILADLINNKKSLEDTIGPLIANTIVAYLQDLQNLKQQIAEHGFAIEAKPLKYKHSKGNEYLLLKADHVKLEATWSDGVLYTSEADRKTLIIRDKKEFYDGRFTLQT